MSNKYWDYTKVEKVILSCKTTAQNNIAYHMVLLYEKKWKDVVLSGALFGLADLKCIEICNRR